MIQPSFLNCPACRGIRRLRYTQVARGLPELGEKIECADCGHIGLMLVQRRSVFCPACDSIFPARLELSALPGASRVHCAACKRRLVTLHAGPATKSVVLGGGLRRKD